MPVKNVCQCDLPALYPSFSYQGPTINLFFKNYISPNRPPQNSNFILTTNQRPENIKQQKINIKSINCRILLISLQKKKVDKSL